MRWWRWRRIRGMPRAWRNWVAGLLRCRWTTRGRIRGAICCCSFVFLICCDVSVPMCSWAIPLVNNIAGLGAVSTRDSWLTRWVRVLCKTALSRSRHVFFQNDEDMRLFVEQGLVASDKVRKLPGSGVDLNTFRYAPMQPLENRTFHFLLAARLLWDKGVGEYVEAARMVRRKYPTAKFQLLGFLDVQNPTTVSSAQMDDWVKEGVVEYLGVADDVKPHMAAADCVVLPSYREGVPRSLLEAAG